MLKTLAETEKPRFSLELRMPILPPKIPCPWCQKTDRKLKVHHINVAHAERRFCSVECRDAWSYQQQTGECNRK